MKEFEEIHIRHRINRQFKKMTIPYQDFDLLERMIRIHEVQSALISIREYINTIQEVENKNNWEKIEECLHNWYMWTNDLFEEGRYQCTYSHKVTMENLRLKHENIELKKQMETLKKQIEW